MARGLSPTMPRHGGNLDYALKRYGGEAQDWLDLSTGVSPWPYPTDSIDPQSWRDLPSPPHRLITAAARYYGCEEDKVCLSPGTQLAIRLLPTLLSEPQNVAVPTIGYQEHSYAWQRAGHKIHYYESLEALEQLAHEQAVDSAVVINPNNPTCELTPENTLKQLAKKLRGLLVVDEAFADYQPTQSLVASSSLDNIIVLRSIGKFFGLAGARVGFLISQSSVNKELDALFQPWSVNGPAQVITMRALDDKKWQQAQISRITEQRQLLDDLVSQLNCVSSIDGMRHKSHGLFTTLFGNASSLSELHLGLAEQKIWTRLGDPDQDRNWLRLSLPGDQFQRLADTFKRI